MCCPDLMAGVRQDVVVLTHGSSLVLLEGDWQDVVVLALWKGSLVGRGGPDLMEGVC